MSKPDFVWDGRGERGEDARYSVIPGAAASDLRLSGLHFRILAHLGRFNQKKGWCRLSQAGLADMFEVRRQSVNKCVGELVGWGYIDRQSQEETGESFCLYRTILDQGGVSGETDTPPEKRTRGVSGIADTSVASGRTPVSPPRTQKNEHIEHIEEVSSVNAFEEFWTAYPRKTSKGKAREAWASALEAGATAEQMIDGARRYAGSKPDPQYTKHPTTWLNQECWHDEYAGRRSGSVRLHQALLDDAGPVPRDASEPVARQLARAVLAGHYTGPIQPRLQAEFDRHLADLKRAA